MKSDKLTDMVNKTAIHNKVRKLTDEIKANERKRDTYEEINIENIKLHVLKNLSYIKTARKQIGWTIAELSKRSKVSVGVISELENEKKKDKKIPSLVNYIAIVRALGLSESFVLETILEKKSKGKDKTLSDALKEYGIYDEETILFLLNITNFLKQRVKSTK